jgi:DNA-binding Lrp family transcriptional regulator
MDDIDRKIISMLSDNSRIPVSSIASEVGLSQNAVSKRIRALEQSGTISFAAPANINTLGFKLAHIKLPWDQKTYDWALRCPRIYMILRIESTGEMVLIAFAESIDVLNILRDSRIGRDAIVETHTELLKPDFLNISIGEKLKNVAPCSSDCLDCKHFKRQCPGCPGTIKHTELWDMSK